MLSRIRSSPVVTLWVVKTATAARSLRARPSDRTCCSTMPRAETPCAASLTSAGPASGVSGCPASSSTRVVSTRA